MKWLPGILTILVLLSGCGFKKREQAIAQREQELAKVQAELVLREQQLALKERELKERELLLDSTSRVIDSVNVYNPDLIGKWAVKMRCTETDCEGSAIGDVKAEQWEISYNDDSTVTAQAFAGKSLSRVYTGCYQGGVLQLVDDKAIRVSLSFTDKDKMEGTREISQANCKIVYSLSANKVLQEKK